MFHAKHVILCPMQTARITGRGGSVPSMSDPVVTKAVFRVSDVLPSPYSIHFVLGTHD
jgi:hypothetical protein